MVEVVPSPVAELFLKVFDFVFEFGDFVFHVFKLIYFMNCSFILIFWNSDSLNQSLPIK